MRFKLRVDKQDTHVHCTLFAGGANCGTLCFRPDEFKTISDILLGGAEVSDSELVSIVGLENVTAYVPGRGIVKEAA